MAADLVPVRAPGSCPGRQAPRSALSRAHEDSDDPRLRPLRWPAQPSPSRSSNAPGQEANNRPPGVRPRVTDLLHEHRVRGQDDQPRGGARGLVDPSSGLHRAAKNVTARQVHEQLDRFPTETIITRVASSLPPAQWQMMASRRRTEDVSIPRFGPGRPSGSASTSFHKCRNPWTAPVRTSRTNG